MCSAKSSPKSSETDSAKADEWGNPFYAAMNAATEEARAAGVQLRWRGTMADYLRQYRKAEK
jgi:hypothetical protein